MDASLLRVHIHSVFDVVIVQKCNHLNYDMELYNARRPHAKLQYKTPDQKEQEFALRSNGK